MIDSSSTLIYIFVSLWFLHVAARVDAPGALGGLRFKKYPLCPAPEVKPYPKP